jgi:hypothetical protein
VIASYGTFGDGRRRRRRQAFWGACRFLFAVAAVLGVGSYGYQVGVSANQARTDQIEADLGRFQRANLDLRDQIALARQESSAAEAALDGMRQRYAAAIPSGTAAELLAQIRTQLGAGVDPERLALLIEAAGLDEACGEEPVTKRFMPRTPVSTGPISYVRFGDRITITGAGESAFNAAGLAEAWFDPARPIRLEFRTLDGATTTIEGIVPLSHRMPVDGKEYRFSVVSAEPRFVEVTAQTCALPQLDDADPDISARAGPDEQAAPAPESWMD